MLWCYYLGQIWPFEVLLSGPSLAFWGVIIWAKFVFYKTLFVKKHYTNRGFSTFFLKKMRAQIWVWAKLTILSCSELGPDNNTYLAQIIPPFWPIKMCCNTYFYRVFWTSIKIWQNICPPKTDNFSHFAKHRFINKTVLLQPPFFQKLVFFWKQKHWCWTRNTDQNQEKAKTRKTAFERENKTGNQKRRNDWWKNFEILIVSCGSFHETKPKKKDK